MKFLHFTLLATVIAVLIAPLSAAADGGKKKNSFEICTDPTPITGSFVVIDPGLDGPTSGDVFTAVGGIWPTGSIQAGDPDDCSALSPDDRIGTFYVNGHLIRSLVDFTGIPATPEG